MSKDAAINRQRIAHYSRVVAGIALSPAILAWQLVAGVVMAFWKTWRLVSTHVVNSHKETSAEIRRIRLGRVKQRPVNRK